LPWSTERELHGKCGRARIHPAATPVLSEVG
jgi:hypothetical protein